MWQLWHLVGLSEISVFFLSVLMLSWSFEHENTERRSQVIPLLFGNNYCLFKFLLLESNTKPSFEREVWGDYGIFFNSWTGLPFVHNHLTMCLSWLVAFRFSIKEYGGQVCNQERCHWSKFILVYLYYFCFVLMHNNVLNGEHLPSSVVLCS
jgi:hypothetical protein